MSDQWKAFESYDDMRGDDNYQTAYAAGWTISGLATLGTILAVWLFGI